MWGFASRRGGFFPAPVPPVSNLAANHIAFATVERRIEVDGVGIIDRAPIDDAKRISKGRTLSIFVEGPFDGAVQIAHQVSVALGEVARVLGRRHQFGLVDRVPGALEICDHVIPSRTQVLLGIAGRVLLYFCHHSSPVIEVDVAEHQGVSLP